MSEFVNLENTASRPDGVYSKVIDQIKKDSVCPFCPENLEKYHKNPILKNGNYWLFTDNMYPYAGAKYHELIIHKAHVGSLAEVSPEAWAEIKAMIDEFSKEKNIPGGTLILRFGDTRYTGASVRHLHANFVSSDGENPDRQPMMVRVG